MICRIPKSYQKLSKHSYIDFGTATIMLCPRLFLLFLFICSRMDWFHCNQCFRKDGAHFFVTSCGHIFCKTCVTLEKCAVCGTACKHLALSDNLKPQEKMFFKSPVETALQYFSHISQVWSFQKKQTDLLVAFYKHRITKLETAMQEAQQALVSQDKIVSLKEGEWRTEEISSHSKGQPHLDQWALLPHHSQLPHGPASSIAVKWSVGPPQRNLFLIERLALVAWDKEAEVCRDGELPETLIMKPLHQLQLTAYLIDLHLPPLDRGFFLSDHPQMGIQATQESSPPTILLRGRAEPH
ncbi:RING finger protein 212B isoform X8 [Papio anubis]|uniref:RING finger protein 212B isoform X8 n=1 Tax=Papio anubis TaxID=9555 RepID=UPI000B7B920B|nr:RING finger protein 212B isoform X8 [Papio anubis]